MVPDEWMVAVLPPPTLPRAKFLQRRGDEHLPDGPSGSLDSFDQDDCNAKGCFFFFPFEAG